MSGKTNSDIWTGQGSTGKSVTGTTRFTRYTGGSNTFELSEGTDITAYLNSEGYLSGASFTANETVIIKDATGTVKSYAYSNFTKPSKSAFGGGYISKTANTQITTVNDIACIDDTGIEEITISSGFIKDINIAWGEGSGASKGALDTGTLNAFIMVSIYAIYNATSGTSDLLCVEDGKAPVLPSGYSYKREIARIQVDRSTKISNIFNFYEIINSEDMATKILPFNYHKGFEVEKSLSDSIFIYQGACKDDTYEYDIIYKDTGSKILKEFDAAWSAGEAGGLLDTGVIADNTQYYLYTILNESEGKVDFLMSLSATSPTLPTNYNYKKLIGFLETWDYTVSQEHAIWSTDEKWSDSNKDISSGARDNATFAFMPTFEDLFSTGIYVGTFDSSGTQDHYVPTSQNIDPGIRTDSPILFHMHITPENAGVGNVEFFIDYYIQKEGDAIPTAATTLTRIVAMDGTVKEIKFKPIFPSIDVESQIVYNIGRKSTSASDTYTSKIALQTAGFHFIKSQKGSDLQESNL